jgi:hypothetical protein
MRTYIISALRPFGLFGSNDQLRGQVRMQDWADMVRYLRGKLILL